MPPPSKRKSETSNGRSPNAQPGNCAPVDRPNRPTLPRLDDSHAQRVGGRATGVAAPHRAGDIETSPRVDRDPFAAENTRTPPRDGIEMRCPMFARSDRSQPPDDHPTGGEDGTGAERVTVSRLRHVSTLARGRGGNG